MDHFKLRVSTAALCDSGRAVLFWCLALSVALLSLAQHIHIPPTSPSYL